MCGRETRCGCACGKWFASKLSILDWDSVSLFLERTTNDITIHNVFSFVAGNPWYQRYRFTLSFLNGPVSCSFSLLSFAFTAPLTSNVSLTVNYCRIAAFASFQALRELVLIFLYFSFFFFFINLYRYLGRFRNRSRLSNTLRHREQFLFPSWHGVFGFCSFQI